MSSSNWLWPPGLAPRETEADDLLKKGLEVQVLKDDRSELMVKFHAPPKCRYEGDVWSVKVVLPDEYPFKAPSVIFQDRISHSHIDSSSGLVDPELLDNIWDSFVDLVTLFTVILPHLLEQPSEPAADKSVVEELLQRINPFGSKVLEEYSDCASSDSVDLLAGFADEEISRKASADDHIEELYLGL